MSVKHKEYFEISETDSMLREEEKRETVKKQKQSNYSDSFPQFFCLCSLIKFTSLDICQIKSS